MGQSAWLNTSRIPYRAERVMSMEDITSKGGKSFIL
jgi:hypothetical protein